MTVLDEGYRKVARDGAKRRRERQAQEDPGPSVSGPVHPSDLEDAGFDLGDVFAGIFRPIIEDAIRPVFEGTGFLGRILGGAVSEALDAVEDVL